MVYVMSEKRLKHLVTGANGFVGRHLCSYFSKSESLYQIVEGTTTRVDGVDFPKGDVLIHLAGRAHVMNEESSNPAKAFFEANCSYATSVAKKAHAAGVKRFVYVSSVGVYGLSSTPEIITEESPVAPVELYAESKLEGERQLQLLSEELGFELVIVRPALVYGFDAPGNVERVLKFLSRNKVVPFSTDRNQRTFLSVDNLVAFLALVARHPRAKGQIFNIADVEKLSTYKFYRELAYGMRSKALFPKLPRILWKLFLFTLRRRKIYQQLFEDLSLSTSKACSILGWQQPFAAQNALRKTGQHYMAMVKGENIE